MLNLKQTPIPATVRVKPGALDRLGIYAARHGYLRVLVFVSKDLNPTLGARFEAALATSGIKVLRRSFVSSASFEEALELFRGVPSSADAVMGFGGGKALDVAKYVAFLSGLPYVAVPTSLSNDGICSPQSSLTIAGRRRSLPAAMPLAVIIDTAVCLAAPECLWLSGVGDLLAKFTAVVDWKLAFHACGTPVDDFAALLSDASVYQFAGRPIRDLEGMKLLGTTLLLNGVSMGISGSSRPASGSEHLISHALDNISARPRLHGLQVGVATYLMSLIQGQNSQVISRVFTETGFWDAIASDPFERAEWIQAVQLAPTIKSDFYTILSSKDCLPEAIEFLDTDPHLKRCFAPV